MGYINEESSSMPVQFSTGWTGLNGGGSTNRTFLSQSPSARTQFGFRSRPLEGAELAAIKRLDKVGRWGDQAAQLDALDRIQRATTSGGLDGGGIKTVHYRDYTEVTRNPVAMPGGYSYLPSNLSYSTRGAAQITAISSGFRPSPPNPSEMEGEAGKIMRRYRPTKPNFDLTRFIGELRDAPSLFNSANYVPRAIGDVGGGYLNVQFGIVPTISDLQKGAESIIKSHDIVTDFVRNSAQTVHRRFSKQISSSTTSGNTVTHSGVQQSNLGPLVVKRDLGTSDTINNIVEVSYYLNYTAELRTFSTFEFFVGDPYGYTTRMDGYLSKAKKLVGGGLTLPVGYQLTPFTWMLDWFYDIGGLLAYQQDVADNGIVQKSGGHVVEERFHGSVTLNGISNAKASYNGGGQLTYTERIQHRTPGSPYSMSPTWSMDPYKWAIVGALGMLKAKGLQP